jgi:hypothetical protein
VKAELSNEFTLPVLGTLCLVNSGVAKFMITAPIAPASVPYLRPIQDQEKG